MLRVLGDGAGMSRHEPSWVYILASEPRGAIYVGVTTDLVERIGKHRSGAIRGHTTRYKIRSLVWFEEHGSILEAIAREKRLKRWRRAWKTELIEAMNPTWRDLWFDIVEDPARDPLRFPAADGSIPS
jgi:putative endonuclease